MLRERALAALHEACTTGDAEKARGQLGAGLASTDATVVQRAAELVRKHQFAGFEAELASAFARLLAAGAQADAGCRAKLAIVEALDYLETNEEETFRLGARCVQLEPGWGGASDSASGVRARSIVALARVGYEDLGLLAAELLADREPPVRQAAADALAHHGARSHAAILLFKLAVGDEDPNATLAVMSALLSLAPDWALPKLEQKLAARDEQECELAALALGQSRRAEALALLQRALAACVRGEERATFLRAIGLHRSEQALTALLEIVATGGAADARVALEALAVRRYEPGVPERVREAAARNANAALRAQYEVAFEDVEAS